MVRRPALVRGQVVEVAAAEDPTAAAGDAAGDHGQPADARGVLEHAADVAVGRPAVLPPTPPHGRFLLVVEREGAPTPAAELQGVLVQLGSGRRRVGLVGCRACPDIGDS
jgi:hypothetical protein